VVSKRGIVATSQVLASQAGADMLARGGSAVDAAIAANAVLSVMEPMMAGPGGNLCPAKFACIGCSGNAPDPDRRYQIEVKKAWATEQATWAKGQGLFTEQRQMKQIQSDCELILEEMDLIVRARQDSAQATTIHRGKTR